MTDGHGHVMTGLPARRNDCIADQEWMSGAAGKITSRIADMDRQAFHERGHALAMKPEVFEALWKTKGVELVWLPVEQAMLQPWMALENAPHFIMLIPSCYRDW